MKSEFLARIPLFEMLDPNELAQLSETTTIVAVAAGQFLFRRGDYGDALYIAETGLLEAVIDEDTPTERSLNTFFPGDYFGEMALLAQAPRSASVRALLDSRLIRLSYEQFSNLLENNPVIALHLSKVLSHYLSRTNAHLSRRGARISTVIPCCAPMSADALAAQLLASLEKQFGNPAIVVRLGDSILAEPSKPGSTDISDILENIRPLSSGGHCLHFGEDMLQSMDDQALVAVLNRLRSQYGHIIVWTKPSEALRRVSFLTRLDQTFLIACHPVDSAELGMLAGELDNVLKGTLRAAYLAPRGQSLPMIPFIRYPPIKLGPISEGRAPDEGVDRLARALAGLAVGLALGSGTAQGLSHLGVMKALVEAGIPIDLIAGTSGGALYGSMIASGLTIEESVSSVVHQTRRNLIDKLDFVIPVRGLIRGSLIEKMVRSCIGDIAFSELPTPLYAVAADLDTGEEVVLSDGRVYQAVRASISVPGIFEPYSLQGRLLIDGVVVNPLPVSVARAMGANIVIAVQVPAPGKVSMEASARANNRKQRSHHSLISSIIRSHHFVGERLADKSASEADVFIKPDVTRFGWREYRAASEIIEAGYQAGQGAIKQIKDLMQGNSRGS